MEQEQILQRLAWLDEERRKDGMTMATLKERVNSLEASANTVSGQLKELSTEITRLSTAMGKFDQLESAIAQVRVDVSKMVDNLEKQRTERERDAEKVRKGDLENINKTLAELKKSADSLGEMKKSMQARVEEDYRLAKMVEDLHQRFTESQRGDEEYRRLIKAIEEGARQDTKRVSDLQAEVAAFRKRLDEARGKADLQSEGLRKLETRFNDLQASEGERRQAQAAFLEKQALYQVERDRVWKEWEARFDEYEKRGETVEQQIQALENTRRSLKRTQEEFEEVSGRFERRINEITEMQRLNEDRLKQDWTGFKADDQKRWTNYTLAQEEQQREITRLLNRLDERLQNAEDSLQENHELFEQTNEDTYKRLQSLLNSAHEWMESFERSFPKRTS